MPLHALFNPSLSSVPISTAKLVFKAPLAPRFYTNRAHSTAGIASLPLAWRDAWSKLFPSSSPASPSALASPSACCPHPHPSSFNADSNFNSVAAYWYLRRTPSLQRALTDKFHEIEQFYLGTESRTARAWRRTIKACWRGWRCGGRGRRWLWIVVIVG